MVGYIDSYETMGLVDGPGIRFVVFMQGCPLRCLFCHNPETWVPKKGMEVTPEELVDRIKRYQTYFGDQGGVTFSGGEPLMQPDFLLETLKLCKENNISTCLDTCGYSFGREKEILAYTDLIIMDIKAIDRDEYKYITSQSIDKSLDFLKLCQEMNQKMWLRQVIVPGINDDEKHAIKLKNLRKSLKNIERVELLPYHLYGEEKYHKLNIPYPLKGVKPMDIDKCKRLELIVNED